MLCGFCGNKDVDAMDFDKDRGFWCEWCEGYTFINSEERHSLKLILEDKINGEELDVPKTKLRKQISPLRYPGGKSKLIDYIYSELNTENLQTFVEPFAGGGSVGLSLLEGGIIKELVLNDLDYGIYSLFKSIKENSEKLIIRIDNYIPNRKDYFKYQKIIEEGYIGISEEDAGFMYLVVNRLAYSGIVKANPLGGKRGTYEELTQRWNSKTLIKRIKMISKFKDRIRVENRDALEVIEEYYWKANTTIFIDPPYVDKGPDLYNIFYIEKDHIELRQLVEGLYFGAPGADMLLTYDNEKIVKNIYSFAEHKNIKRVYSI